MKTNAHAYKLIRSMFNLIASCAVACLTLISCAKQNFSTSIPNDPVQSSSTPASGTVNGLPGNPSGCNLNNLKIPIKVLFIVDTSGSNLKATMNRGTQDCMNVIINGVPIVCAPATDPQKNFRSGSITNFFNLYKGRSNFSWGLERFSNSSATSYIQNTAFGNSNQMDIAITEFNNTLDEGNTPYKLALEKAKLLIASDPDLTSSAPNSALYKLVFLSDGFPSDAYDTRYGTIDMTDIQRAISELISLSPTRITLSTAYYGAINDPLAADTLKSMSTLGNGQFVNVNTSSTSTFVIEDLIKVSSNHCN